MRMTAIQAQTERKRQDRSARRAEKHHRRARTRRFRGLIRTVSAACAAIDAAQGEKRLSGGRIQAIVMTEGNPLGECRLGAFHRISSLNIHVAGALTSGTVI
ncbi:hypothetical protein [Roseicyclus sp.]|uniref:hypothetical protein n=1 Tax=Roseicyclus sp. TaxID=1914329 RepID=UPI001BCC255F|nr:hypothetical protein [Roseicyclus sp.]